MNRGVERRHAPAATLLWICIALFAARVIGQFEVMLFAPDWLPPMEAWFSGLLPYHLLLPPEDRQQYLLDPAQTQRTGEVETRWVKDDGTIIDVWVGTTVLPDPSGAFLRSRSAARPSAVSCFARAAWSNSSWGCIRTLRPVAEVVHSPRRGQLAHTAPNVNTRPPSVSSRYSPVVCPAGHVTVSFNTSSSKRLLG